MRTSHRKFSRGYAGSCASISASTTAAYSATIERLDSFTDLDDALLYMQENFEWDPDSEGVQLLVDLLERKLS